MITLTDDSTDEDINAVFTAPVGTIIKLNGEYEGLAYRINQLTPDDSLFQWTDVLPGTELYTDNGANTLVVTIAGT